MADNQNNKDFIEIIKSNYDMEELYASSKNNMEDVGFEYDLQSKDLTPLVPKDMKNVVLPKHRPDDDLGSESEEGENLSDEDDQAMDVEVPMITYFQQDEEYYAKSDIQHLLDLINSKLMLSIKIRNIDYKELTSGEGRSISDYLYDHSEPNKGSSTLMEIKEIKQILVEKEANDKKPSIVTSSNPQKDNLGLSKMIKESGVLRFKQKDGKGTVDIMVPPSITKMLTKGKVYKITKSNLLELKKISSFTKIMGSILLNEVYCVST